jgi:hypothetical protein
VSRVLGWGHATIGAIWGGLTSFSAVFLNDNYERLFPWADGSPSVWALAGLGFLLVSLFVLGIMLLSGLIYAVLCRFGPRRWKVIPKFFLFLFPGIVVAKVVGAAL